MKKLMLALFTFVVFSQAHALTLADCERYSDEDIARLFMDSIALGGQTGTANLSCLNSAKSLDVSSVGEELSEAEVSIVNANTDYRIVSMEAPSEQNMYRPVVHYVVRLSTGKNVSGQFAFKRHRTFINPESINRRKCASIVSQPTLFFMLNNCRN